MFTRRLTPIFLACSVAISLFSMTAQAQTTSNLNLFNKNSLPIGLSATGARSFEQLRPVNAKAPTPGVSASTPTSGPNGNVVAGVGTTGANNPSAVNGSTVGAAAGGAEGSSGSMANGSSGSSTINGTTQMANSSNGQYTYNGNGQMVSTGAADNGFMGPMQPTGTVIGATGGAASDVDWMKVIQVAAPILASVTGNAQIGQVAGIIGSGAQIYNAVSTGQELTVQNYANIGNIALQTAALATNNTNIDRAAQLGTVGLGAWNSYTALTSNTTGAANVGAVAAQPTLVGYTATGQPVFQSAAPTATTSAGPSWTAVGTVATSLAPQLGQVFNNPQIGQAGAALGQAAVVYGQQTAGAQTQPQYQVQGQPQYQVQGQPQYQVQGQPQLQVPQTLQQLLMIPGMGPAAPASPAQMVRDTATLANTNATLDRLLSQPTFSPGQVQEVTPGTFTPTPPSSLSSAPSLDRRQQVANESNAILANQLTSASMKAIGGWLK